MTTPHSRFPRPPGPPLTAAGADVSGDRRGGRTPHFLMCRPTHYRIAYEINPWMRITCQPHHKKALIQWQKLYSLLSRKLGVSVKLLPPHRGVPDLVFTANAGLVSGKTMICSNFKYRQRQKEEPIIERFFQKAGYRVLRLPSRHSFEGEGDALWVGSTLLMGFRFRSDATVHAQLSTLLKTRVLPVELVDKRFYHLDTCFAPLSPKTALWFPGAFDRYGKRVIRSLIPDLIAVSEKDAKRFVCNTIIVPASAAVSGARPGSSKRRAGGPVARSLVMPVGASSALKRKLAQRRFRIHEVELSEFLKAGGGAKCLVLKLN